MSNVQEMTPSLGGTSFLPGSQRVPRGRVDEESMVTLAPPLGAWLAFDGRVLHRGEANVETWAGPTPNGKDLSPFFKGYLMKIL